MTDLDKLARGLTETARAMIAELCDDWRGGPTLPDSLINELAGLREAGLVEREFGDVGKPELTASQRGFRARLSACWWFRLSETGLALKQHIKGGERDG